MKIVGIIAEYDPFHNGHAWQLAQARKAGAEKIIVCLSTAATQRGALPLLDESVRICAALSCGADIVISLPAVYAASGAEQFARAGVAILAAAGCDTLVFGAETPGAAQLMGCAAALASDAYEAALAQRLTDGARNFAQARQQAIDCLYPNENFAQMLANPNDNLAIEYCKAILQQNAPLSPYALPRIGALHGQALGRHDKKVKLPLDLFEQPVQNTAQMPMYASGSALRVLWQTGGAAALRGYVRPVAYDLYHEAQQQGAYTDWGKVDIALLARLRAAVPQGFAMVRGVTEGLEYRLAEAVKNETTADALYDALTTVRYPRARMRRLCLDAAMGVQKGKIPPLPPYLHLLGAHKDSLGLLKSATLPVSASLAVLREMNEECKAVADLQTVFCDFQGLCRAKSSKMGAAYTKKIVIF